MDEKLSTFILKINFFRGYSCFNNVGGNIEVLPLNNGDTLVTNQDGRMMNLNYNSEATKIFQENTSVKGIDIVGQEIAMKKGRTNIEIETE